MLDMSLNIFLNLRPSTPLPVFANRTSPVNDINENMINNMIATIRVTVNALVNVFIADCGIAAVIIVKLVALLDMALMLA